MKAINPKYQSLVNKAIKYDQLYNYWNNRRNDAEQAADPKEFRKADSFCIEYFDKYSSAMDELPAREKLAVIKHLNP